MEEVAKKSDSSTKTTEIPPMVVGYSMILRDFVVVENLSKLGPSMVLVVTWHYYSQYPSVLVA